MKNLAIATLGFFLSTEAYGLGILIHGTEAKVHGGSGFLSTHGAPALFQNPSQLRVATDLELYTEISALSLNYAFQYPDQKTYNYKTSGFIPYIGFAQNLSPTLSWGLVLLPLPPSLSRITLNSILTRETGDEPVPVNVKRQGGDEIGIIAGLGVSYSPIPNLFLGLAFNVDQREFEEKIEYVDGQLLRELKVRQADRQLRLGATFRGFSNQLTLSLALVPWRQKSENGQLKQLSFPDWDYASIDDKTSGPKEFSFGLGWRQAAWDLRLETVYTEWTGMGQSRGSAMEYQDTWDRALSLTWHADAAHSATLGLGYYPENLGDGVMKTRTANYVETRGFSYGDLESLPRYVVSLGYRLPLVQKDVQTYLLNERAERRVGESAKAYGTHRLDLWMLGISCRIGS